MCADCPNAYKRQDPQSEAAQAAKKRSRLNALIILLIPVLGTLLPSPYKACAPFLLLIPLFISLADKFRKAEEKSTNPGNPDLFDAQQRSFCRAISLYTEKMPEDKNSEPIG